MLGWVMTRENHRPRRHCAALPIAPRGARAAGYFSICFKLMEALCQFSGLHKCKCYMPLLAREEERNRRGCPLPQPGATSNPKNARTTILHNPRPHGFPSPMAPHRFRHENEHLEAPIPKAPCSFEKPPPTAAAAATRVTTATRHILYPRPSNDTPNSLRHSLWLFNLDKMPAVLRLEQLDVTRKLRHTALNVSNMPHTRRPRVNVRHNHANRHISQPAGLVQLV